MEIEGGNEYDAYGFSIDGKESHEVIKDHIIKLVGLSHRLEKMVRGKKIDLTECRIEKNYEYLLKYSSKKGLIRVKERLANLSSVVYGFLIYQLATYSLLIAIMYLYVIDGDDLQRELSMSVYKLCEALGISEVSDEL